jgi:predicted ATP-grasp superfamily ATP-dependent carboligase
MNAGAWRQMSGKGGRVLVLGDYRQTVTIVRSLARGGFRIALGTDQWRSSTALSRYVSDVRVFDESNRDRFLDQLEAYLRHEKPDYVFPVGENQARCIVCAAERFMPLATWVMPDPATVLRCFDKRALYELTPTLGIPTAPWREYTDCEDWSRAARDMGFPVVVKRKDSSAPIKLKKAIILRTPAEFDSLVGELRSDPDPQSLLLQKFASGERHNCHIAADRGRIVAFFQQKVLRTDEFDGTGIGVEGVSVPISPELRTYCERLIEALDYDGVGCIQFMVDEHSASVAFLEFNPRMDSTAALPYRLGYDYPRIAVEIAARHAPAALTTAYRTGKRYHWLYGDALAWLACCRHGRQSGAERLDWALRMLWSTLTSHHHLTWDARDPVPTLHQYWKKLSEVILKRLPPALRPVPQLPRPR